MEVGAVKQAFNNEVIHLKKNLNQAKIQIIHKLTRKAKTLNDKKAPDTLKEKLKRKAESAINEVLIIKKIKPRDVARFTVTHTGKLNDYLNKPQVDQNKACARLLLHKALQEKYKLIRDKFGNISINDLLMTRQERRKLKKEMKDKLKDKKKGKVKPDPQNIQTNGDESMPTQDGRDEEMIDKNGDISENNSSDISDDSDEDNSVDDKLSTDTNEAELKLDSDGDSAVEDHDHEMGENNSEIGKFVRPPPTDDETDTPDVNPEINTVFCKSPINDATEDIILQTQSNKASQLKKSKKTVKQRENKNKNINNKILNRNFNKKTDELPHVTKVVDPFFVTSSGDNYMSLAEPRAPDEVKEVHKQGNRQYRRAVMFGHVPKIKPRPNNFNNNPKLINQNNSKFSQQESNKHTYNKRNDRNINDKSKRGRFNDNSNDTVSKIEEKPEKLHPSWEAKKKHSSILPFQGKKIVFDDS